MTTLPTHPFKMKSIKKAESFHPECLSWDDMVNLKWRSYCWPDGSQGKDHIKPLSHCQYINWFDKEYIKMEKPCLYSRPTRDNLSWHYPYPSSSTYVRDFCGGKYGKMARKSLVSPSDVKFVGCTTYLLDYQPIGVSYLKGNLERKQRAPNPLEKPKFYSNVRLQSTYEADFKDFMKLRQRWMESKRSNLLFCSTTKIF